MELRYSEDALIDLMQIGSFIAQDNPKQARSFVREVKAHCEKLAVSPFSSAVVEAIGDDVRRSVFGNCNIYYLIEEDVMVIFGVVEGHRRQAHALIGR